MILYSVQYCYACQFAWRWTDNTFVERHSAVGSEAPPGINQVVVTEYYTMYSVPITILID